MSVNGGGEDEQGGLYWKGLWDPERAEPEGAWRGSFRAESHPTSASSSVLWAQDLPFAPYRVGWKVNETEEGEALVPSYRPPYPTHTHLGWTEAGLRRQEWGSLVSTELQAQGFRLGILSPLPDLVWAVRWRWL